MTFKEFLEGIANAIRSKTGSTNPIKPINFAQEINNIQAGGGASGFDAWINGDTTELTINTEKIAPKAFYCYNKTHNRRDITKLIAPNVKEIGDSAFESRDELLEIDCPNLETIGYNAFSYCEGLISIDLPNVKTLRSFASCYNLKNVNFPKLEKIDGSGLRYCTGLEYITFPETLTYMGSNTLDGATALKEVTFLGKTPPTTWNAYFNNCKNFVINVGWSQEQLDLTTYVGSKEGVVVNYNYTGN